MEMEMRMLLYNFKHKNLQAVMNLFIDQNCSFIIKQNMSAFPKETNIDNQKYNQLKIINFVMERNISVNSLHPQMIMELLNIFKINFNPSTVHSEGLKLLKEKLTDILLIEKDQYLNYLALSKFKSLNEMTMKTLERIFFETWKQFERASFQFNPKEKSQFFTCQSENINEMEQFHMQIYNYIKSGFFSGCIGSINSSFFPNPSPHLFDKFQKSNFDAFPPSFGPPINQHFLMKQSPYMMDPYSKPIENISNPIPGSSVKIQEYPQSHSQFYRQIKQNQKGLASSAQQNLRKPQKIKLGPEQQPLSKQRNEDFSNCVCEGLNYKSDKYYICQECQKKIHYSCIRLSVFATPYRNAVIRCPLCIVKSKSIYYEVIGEPLKKKWLTKYQFFKKQFTIDHKTSLEILNKRYGVQIRFVRVSGESMFDQKHEGINENYVKKVPLVSEVILKYQNFQTQEKTGEIRFNFTQKQKQLSKTELLYMLVTCIRLKTVEEILQTKLDYFEDDYLDKCFKEPDNPDEKLAIEILKSDFNLIQIPVRGTNCSHQKVMDFKEFLEGQHSKCFLCPEKCQNYKIDRKIQQCLRKIQDQYGEEQEEYPTLMYYHKNGEFTYQDKPDQCQNHQDQMEIEDQ